MESGIAMVYVEWFPGVYRGVTLVVSHPGTKGPKFLQVKMLQVQPRVIWALSRSTKLYGLAPA